MMCIYRIYLFVWSILVIFFHQLNQCHVIRSPEIMKNPDWDLILAFGPTLNLFSQFFHNFWPLLTSFFMPLIEIDERNFIRINHTNNRSYKYETSLWNLSDFCVPHNWHFLVFLATFEIEIVNRKWKIFFWCSVSLKIINKSALLACTIHQTLILLGIKPSNRDYS